MRNKAYKFRIYPDDKQMNMLARTFGCVRFVFNFWLNRKIKRYEDDKKSVSYTTCAKELAEMKHTEEYSFLKEVDSIALQQALRHLDTAFKNFYRLPQTGFPKFKSKKKNKDSYTTICVNGNIRISDGYLKLPKIGNVKIKQHREIPDMYILKSVTLSRTPSGKYYASILYEYEESIHKKEMTEFLGLDYSMSELYIDSNGNEPEYPGYYRQAEKKLKREQRKLSLMQKGSKNRDKQRIKVARLHEKVANQRKDFLHKESRQITNAYDCVCVENLDMKEMSQEKRYGKSISDNGWGMFLTFLSYKLEEQGKQLIKVDRYFASSQICSCCGYKNEEIKDLSIRKWICPKCSTSHNRDKNAAINIRNEGMRIVLA